MSQAYNPYGTPPPEYHSPPRKKSNAWIWVLLACIAGGTVLMCCGGGGGLVYFGLNLIGQEVADDLRDHPKVQEQLGGIEEISFNFTKSAARDDDDEYVFDVKGPKGTGTLICKTADSDDGETEVVSASLRTSDGQTHVLRP
jgi:hypothetical protein